METKTNENGNKKYLVPLVALLLCAVACIGVGYAYNSTNSTSDNIITNDAEVLTLEGGVSASRTVQFDVDYKTTVTNGEVTYAVDKDHSALQRVVTLKLASSTGVTKNVTLACSDIADIGGVKYTVEFFAVAADGVTPTGTAIKAIDVPANGDGVKLCIKLTVDCSKATADLATVGGHVSPAFTLTFTTQDVTHDDSGVKAQA